MKNLIMTIAVAIMTTFAASAQFMVVTTVNTPDSDLNEEWGTTNFTDNLGIGYVYNDKCVVGLVRAGEDSLKVTLLMIFGAVTTGTQTCMFQFKHQQKK
jgi:hypothetical protein